MSFSWRTNSFSGEVGNDPLTQVNVANNFPTAPLTSLTVSQAAAHSNLYQIPGYLLLKDMTADKSNLINQRGGYSAENPNKQQSKLRCYTEQASSTYYCDVSKSYNAMLNATTPSH